MADLKVKTPNGDVDVLTPLKAIRAKCIDCSGGNREEVKLCPCYKCTLWPYRSGHSPHPGHKRNGNGNIDALKRANANRQSRPEENLKEEF